MSACLGLVYSLYLFCKDLPAPPSEGSLPLPSHEGKHLAAPRPRPFHSRPCPWLLSLRLAPRCLGRTVSEQPAHSLLQQTSDPAPRTPQITLARIHPGFPSWALLWLWEELGFRLPIPEMELGAHPSFLHSDSVPLISFFTLSYLQGTYHVRSTVLMSDPGLKSVVSGSINS